VSYARGLELFAAALARTVKAMVAPLGILEERL
jgi:hypothetical protein